MDFCHHLHLDLNISERIKQKGYIKIGYASCIMLQNKLGFSVKVSGEKIILTTSKA